MLEKKKESAPNSGGKEKTAKTQTRPPDSHEGRSDVNFVWVN